MKHPLSFVAPLVSACLACSTLPALPDASTDASIDTATDAPELDAGTDASEDAGTCEPCDPGRACLRGVCVATCGLDVATLDEQLGPDVVPIAQFCVPGLRMLEVRDDATPELYFVDPHSSASFVTVTLSRFALDPAVELPVIENVMTVSREFAGDAFPTPQQLAVAPDASRALISYTATTTDPDLGVFDVSFAPPVTVTDHAFQNIDMTFVAPDEWLGVALGSVLDVRPSGTRTAVQIDGPILIAAELLGDVLLVGGLGAPTLRWPDGSTHNRIAVFDRAAALSTGVRWADRLGVFDAWPRFEAVGSRGIVWIALDPTTGASLGARLATVDDASGRWRLGTPEVLSGALFHTARAAGEHVLLVHAGGALLIE